MYFNNYNHISKSVLKKVIPEIKKQLLSYNLKKNSYFELWYNDQKKVIEVTNYDLMRNEVVKLFKYDTKIDKNGKHVSFTTPKNKKIIKELNLDTIEKLNEYHNSFEENYINTHLITLEISMELYKGLKPDYYGCEEAILEWDTKENTLKKLKKDLELYIKTIKELENK